MGERLLNSYMEKTISNGKDHSGSVLVLTDHEWTGLSPG